MKSSWIEIGIKEERCQVQEKLGVIYDVVVVKVATYLFILALLEERFDAAVLAFIAILLLTVPTDEKKEGEKK